MCSWIHGSSLSKLWVQTNFCQVLFWKILSHLLLLDNEQNKSEMFKWLQHRWCMRAECVFNLLFLSFLNQRAQVDGSVRVATWSASVRTTLVATQWLDAAPALQAGRDTTARKVRETKHLRLHTWSGDSRISHRPARNQPYVTTRGPAWFPFKNISKTTKTCK